MKLDRTFIIVAIAGLFFNLALGIQTTAHMNFVSTEVGLAAEDIGLLDGIREIPGLLTALLALAALLFTESILATLCLVLLGVGLYLYGQAASFTPLIIGTLVSSIGFHLYGPVQNSILLRTAELNERGRRLGAISAIGALATVLATLLVRFLVPFIGVRSVLTLAAVLAVAGAAVQFLSRQSGERTDIRRGMVFKWQYKSYYWLTLLAGSRRQINYTFAKMALVLLYGVPLTTMATLMLLASLLSIATRPIFGRIIDRLGETRTLSLNYSILIGVFLGYALIPYTAVLYVLFVLDHILLGFDIGITTHLDKIALREDVSPSLAMGSTINHITGILIPVVGGLMWAVFSPRSVFLTGAVICIISLIQVQYLPDPAQFEKKVPAAV
ncbi:MAG: major facilitator superfamily protein [Bacillota bacterium]|nr:MAG: major facilitator superfamily protein [Bacillota bacterium]MBS3949250.1 MFS transporter [Peptococcaceae bacterium]